MPARPPRVNDPVEGRSRFFWLPLPLGEGWGEGRGSTSDVRRQGSIGPRETGDDPHPRPLSQEERGGRQDPKPESVLALWKGHEVFFVNVAVHASTRPEPFGRAIVEAMATGLGVVAIRDGAAAELFDDGQLFQAWEPIYKNIRESGQGRPGSLLAPSLDTEVSNAHGA